MKLIITSALAFVLGISTAFGQTTDKKTGDNERRRPTQGPACPAPLPQRAFDQAYGAFLRNPRDLDADIRSFTRTNCLTVNQVRQLAQLYQYESDRLLFVLDAYGYVFDARQYSSLEILFADQIYRGQFLEFLNDQMVDPTYGYPSVPPPPPPPPVIYVPGYYGPCGCPIPMDNGRFTSVIGTLRNERFESTRLEVAKQIVSTNCLTTNQVGQMAEQFTFENNRLELAKFAYPNTYDVNNYFQLSSIFKYSSNVSALSAYVKQQPTPRGVVTPPQPSTPQQGYYDDTPWNTPTPNFQNPPPQAAPNGYCDYPMDNASFATVRRSIASKDYEDTKLDVAKQIINTNCLTATQIAEIVKLFDYESTRLTFAKEAYKHCFDPDKYFLVNDSFEYDSSISELSKFVQGRP